ncbi:MetQ/NlpA family ABC transporter substrate-binding protein [Schnuerera sp.]|uniref:MetQ/NlpA family ABC transporter substrate-binding protein n=1 Tax=Schnuerera sp. TaxID=2794844 RepID=UPI002D1BB9DC|nr:MetQ/NlpA family ABC transporter substrate-binding protein [Schnuerera sp.]HSH36845.1 MetQ/NlpA family ABC transporter substrate-binding protein [Schnuerera sp.]
MKKIALITLTIILIFSSLVGCTNEESADNLIKIGVSPRPHRELIEFIEEDLKEEGIELEIIQFDDYVKPNLALDEKELDANFFQHEPYMNNFREERNIDIVSIGGVHVEPMGLYSTKYGSINELEDGSEVAFPNDPTNGGRALILLEKYGLIKLDPEAGILATENDIIENPKNLKFTALEAAYLPRVLNEVDSAIINGNYALEASLVPTEDALILEEEDSPYANIIAIRAGEEKEEKYIKLMKVLQSEKVKNFIEENYGGGVIPAF